MKLKSLLIMSTAIISTLAFPFLANAAQGDELQFTETTLSGEEDGYYAELLKNEIHNYKIIRNIPTAYDADSWDQYYTHANAIMNIDPENMLDIQKTLLDDVLLLRQNLKQEKDLEEAILYLWGDSMPSAEDTSALEFTDESFDNNDFRPYLLPYLLDDPSAAEGNMIVIAGGGFSARNNYTEGYWVAEAFNKMGYNCFVLQRRVAPYSNTDAFLDLQRAIRYIRYHAEDLNLGGMDCIAATGFSGGGLTVMGAVEKLYGDVQPTIYDESYVPDEIDQMNADLDVALPVYGIMDPEEIDLDSNKNLPAFFLAVGEKDGVLEDEAAFASILHERGIETEFHSFANVGHAFADGVSGTNSEYWVEMADQFIDQVVGRADYVQPEVEIPETYTKKQEVILDSPIYVAENDDGSAFFIYMIGNAGELNIMEGVLADGEPVVTYDLQGTMSSYVPMFLDACNPDAWEAIN